MQINAKYCENIAHALKTFKIETGRSQNDIAEKTGVPSAYISRMINGFDTIGKSVITPDKYEKVATFLAVNGYTVTTTAAAAGNENNEAESTNTHFNTDNFIRVRAMCAAAQNERKTYLLDSEDSHCGKTYGLTVEAQRSAGAVYVKATAKISSAQILNSILKKLKAEPAKRVNNHQKIKIIGDKMPVNGLLIIDELETVSKKSDVYGALKDLVDAAYGKFGLVVCGLGLFDFIKAKAEKKKAGYPQLLKRVGANYVKIGVLQRSDLDAIAAEKGVKLRAQTEKWILSNLGDIKRLADLWTQIVRINEQQIEGSEAQNAEIREKRLNNLINPLASVTDKMRQTFAV